MEPFPRRVLPFLQEAADLKLKITSMEVQPRRSCIQVTPAPPWQACGWVKLSVGFREPSVNPEKIPQEVTPNHKDGWAGVNLSQERKNTISPVMNKGSVPSPPCLWSATQSLSSAVKWPTFGRAAGWLGDRHGSEDTWASLFPPLKSLPPAPAPRRNGNHADGSLTRHKLPISAFSGPSVFCSWRHTPISNALLIWGSSEHFKQRWLKNKKGIGSHPKEILLLEHTGARKPFLWLASNC